MTNSNTLTFTKNALKRIIHLKNEHGNNHTKLRVYIVGGGCSGFQYGFKLDEAETASDDVIIQKDFDNQIVTIVIDPLSFQYLLDAEVDYKISLQGSKFTVNNPNADATCGCGSSFSLKE